MERVVVFTVVQRNVIIVVKIKIKLKLKFTAVVDTPVLL